MLKAALPRFAGAAAPFKERVHVPGALKYVHFRNYWLAMMASVTGYQMLILFCLGWLVSHELEGDARDLGYVSTAVAVPAIALNLFGGVFADKANPKRLLGLTQFSTGAVVVGLGVLTVMGDVDRWHVLVAAVLIGALQAFDTPTRQSLFPRLVSREALSNAVALNSTIWTGTRIFAPAIAGLMIGRTDISAAIFLSSAGFIVLALVAQTLTVAPVERARGSFFKEVQTGFLFIKRSRIFSLLIGMTFFIGFFGMSYVFLMPVFADEVLDVGPQRLGWLMGVAGLGALIGIFIGALLSHTRYRGWLLIGGAALFGGCLILFSLASDAQLYWHSMATLFIGDMGASIYLMSVMITLQTLVPDQYRGRVMGFYAITWSMIPLGGLVLSQIAHHAGPPVAVRIGGAMVLGLVLIVALGSERVRALHRQDAVS